MQKSYRAGNGVKTGQIYIKNGQNAQKNTKIIDARFLAAFLYHFTCFLPIFGDFLRFARNAGVPRGNFWLGYNCYLYNELSAKIVIMETFCSIMGPIIKFNITSEVLYEDRDTINI